MSRDINYTLYWKQNNTIESAQILGAIISTLTGIRSTFRITLSKENKYVAFIAIPAIVFPAGNREEYSKLLSFNRKIAWNMGNSKTVSIFSNAAQARAHHPILIYPANNSTNDITGGEVIDPNSFWATSNNLHSPTKKVFICSGKEHFLTLIYPSNELTHTFDGGKVINPNSFISTKSVGPDKQIATPKTEVEPSRRRIMPETEALLKNREERRALLEEKHRDSLEKLANYDWQLMARQTIWSVIANENTSDTLSLNDGPSLLELR